VAIPLHVLGPVSAAALFIGAAAGGNRPGPDAPFASALQNVGGLGVAFTGFGLTGQAMSRVKTGADAAGQGAKLLRGAHKAGVGVLGVTATLAAITGIGLLGGLAGTPFGTSAATR
jgi:hypothetical protein